jgi:hypothetical protein
MRKTRRRGLKRVARRRQRDVLCDVMLGARECETWLTLDELAKLTHYPPASISAQLRHLRKPAYGGYVVEKRQRAIESIFARGRLRNGVGIPVAQANPHNFGQQTHTNLRDKVRLRITFSRWPVTEESAGPYCRRSDERQAGTGV